MSYRDVDFTENAFGRFVREVYDRLSRLEAGLTNRGRASFAGTILVGDVELVCTPGNGGIAGNLLAGIIAGANTMTLRPGQGAAFPPAPFTVQVEAEKIHVVGKSGDVLSPIARGYAGTIAVLHPIGALVRLNSPDAIQVIARNTKTGSESLLAVLP